MIKSADNDIYEDIRLLRQDLTSWGLLLSEQCTHTVKVAVFTDAHKTVFRDRKEFSGGLFKQLEEPFDYLRHCNQNRSVIDGFVRTDYWDYPEAAIRETMLNARIQREYRLRTCIHKLMQPSFRTKSPLHGAISPRKSGHSSL